MIHAGLIATALTLAGFTATEHKTAKLWEPVDWRFENSSIDGNPFDLPAEATFRHEDGKETIRTGLFYSDENTWVLRFTGTLKGKWTFAIKSTAPDLDGQTGEVKIEPNPGVAGFMIK